MSSMSSDSNQKTVLQHGEAFYTQGKLDDAFSAFRKVILLCDCNKNLRASSKRLGISSKDIPLPICHCKDYLSLPTDDPDSCVSDKEAIFRLATQPCCCGSGIVPCQNSAHLKALLNIASVSVARKADLKAVQYASLAITLAPHAPEGYLRMVTILRQGGLPCTPDVASRCNWFATQASHSVRAHGDKSHEMLEPIGRRIRRDIVRGVPAEIRQMIFRHLKHIDVCRAMRVSKVWKVFSQDRQLWKDLKFVKNWRHHGARSPFRPGVLNNIVKLSGHMATSLTIDGLWDFKFNAAKLRAMLEALSELKSLSLAGGYRYSATQSRPIYPSSAGRANFSEFWPTIWEAAPSTLNSLHLSAFDTNRTLSEPRPILKGSHFATSLKELSLVQLHSADAKSVIDSVFSQNSGLLRTLIVKQCTLGGNLDLDLTKFTLPLACLSSLTLDGAMLRSGQATEDHGEQKANWECLEQLVLGSLYSDGSRFPISNVLRSLELNENGFRTMKKLAWDSEALAPATLEHFRFHYNQHNALIPQLFGLESHLLDEHDPLFAVLRPSIENRTLRSLDLTFSKEIQIAFDGLFKNDQKDAILTLSCHDITMPSIISGFGGSCNEFLNWVKTFPNLMTVGVYPERSDDTITLISRLMNDLTGIRTIYTNVLKGADRDMVLAEAKKRAITIVHADRVPTPALEWRHTM